jgi:hypothetical protein
VSTTPDVVVGGPSATGVLIHRLVAELARGSGPRGPEWSVREARRLIKEWGEGGHAPVYRQAVRMRAITAVGVYFAEFARPGWRLIGALLIAGDAEFDLVWRHAGRIEADELKTGRFGDAEVAAARVQATRQVAAGRSFFGRAFAGVRVVSLSSPEQAFWVGA